MCLFVFWRSPFSFFQPGQNVEKAPPPLFFWGGGVFHPTSPSFGFSTPPPLFGFSTHLPGRFFCCWGRASRTPLRRKAGLPRALRPAGAWGKGAGHRVTERVGTGERARQTGACHVGFLWGVPRLFFWGGVLKKGKQEGRIRNFGESAQKKAHPFW